MTAKARLLVLSSFVLLLGLSAQVGQAQRDATWYWTPALCKSSLHNKGMQLSDGRYFYAANSYCIGSGGPVFCEWSSGYRYRLYRRFTAIARSYDGVVRIFILVPTSRDGGYTAANIRAIGHESSGAAFDAYAAPIAHALAHAEQEKGCGAYRP